MKDLAVNDYTTIEYEYGTTIAGELRGNTNKALGDILTLIEATSSNSEQCEATKKLVKDFIWRLMDENQHAVYRTLKVESWPVGSSDVPALAE